MGTLDHIIAKYPDYDFLKADGLDEAVIGVTWDQSTGHPILVYSQEKILEIFEKQGMDSAEAREFYEFNTLGAYVGPQTPIFVEGDT